MALRLVDGADEVVDVALVPAGTKSESCDDFFGAAAPLEQVDRDGEVDAARARVTETLALAIPQLAELAACAEESANLCAGFSREGHAREVKGRRLGDDGSGRQQRERSPWKLGTGDLEITLSKADDLDKAKPLIELSYGAS